MQIIFLIKLIIPRINVFKENFSPLGKGQLEELVVCNNLCLGDQRFASEKFSNDGTTR